MELEINRDDSKKFWKNIHNILPNGKLSNKIISLVDEETKNAVPEGETAAFINNFFANIGSKLARNFNTPWYYDGDVADVKLESITTNEIEVLRFRKEIDIHNSSYILDISSRILKDTFIILITKFTKLINCSFVTGIFPEYWKLANVIPLFKGGNKNVVGNFRPVSLLPLPSKIIEKIVHDRISTFLENNNLLDIYQGGFRKNQSTINTIAQLTDTIFEGINNRELTLTCYIDMAKAFDTVNHSILVKKLANLGINDKLLNWIKNYLTGRKQCTTTNNITSSYLDISCGVLQGSILGPLFFIIYVNDINRILKNCKHLLCGRYSFIYDWGY